VVFFQLKKLFHTLESIGSARIEGNNTTIAEYIETKIDSTAQITEPIKEIQNMEHALEFIDTKAKDEIINRNLICDLHKITVNTLTPPPDGEGDETPGLYRLKQVRINNASVIPPAPQDIQWYMDELFDFVQTDGKPKYDLLKIAIAHHRFLWIHPFTNGNGRTGRLFTYLLLIKMGFNVNIGRILNPTAVFCSNRKEYYKYLALADTGTDEGILSWCEYALDGLKNEIEKIDKLLNYEYLSKEILKPALKMSLQRGVIAEHEEKILQRTVEKQVLKASDLTDILKGKTPSEISRQIGKLKDMKMLTAEKDGTRKYVLRFDNNFLLRSIIEVLGQKGFLPAQHNEK